MLAGREARAQTRGDDDVRVSVFVQGGRGTLRQGIVRRLVARFELREGLHVYGEPVPDGMVATRVEVSGPEGLVTLDPVAPPTRPLHLAGLDLTLNVWDGGVDIAVPFYPRAEIVSECRPVDEEAVPVDVTVRYQACDDATCFAPKTETFHLDLGREPVDMPDLAFHGETGQRKSTMDGAPHMRRLILRQLRRHPLGVLRSVVQMVGLRIAARKRAGGDADAP
ncbi:MAG: protein-disulfide reductase DsbD domain-containing protein [Myxococcota bacterium]